MTIVDSMQNNIPFLSCDGFTAAGGVAHGFSTRLGGVSEGIYDSLNLGLHRGDEPERVEENFRRFTAAIGADFEGLVLSNQVHGNTVRTITAADRGRGLQRPLWEADGLITDIPGVCLTIFTADCLPVLLYDPVRRVVSAVHAGWRGTAMGIAGEAVKAMVERYGSCPGDILAAIGPGISLCCFETDEDVPNAMTEALGASALHHIEVRDSGKFHVDLKGMNALRLEKAGLSPDHIAVSDACTMCQHDRFWSHRYTRGQRGSQAAMIQLL